MEDANEEAVADDGGKPAKREPRAATRAGTTGACRETEHHCSKWNSTATRQASFSLELARPWLRRELGVAKSASHAGHANAPSECDERACLRGGHCAWEGNMSIREHERVAVYYSRRGHPLLPLPCAFGE